MYKDQGRRKWTKLSLFILLIVLVFALVYVSIVKDRKSSSISIELTSKTISEYRRKDESQQSAVELQQLLEQTEKLSFDLSKGFSQDLKKLKGFIPSVKRRQHKDYLHHSLDRSLEKSICQRPYKLIILCLDETNLQDRNLYRKTWADERKEILTSDGIMTIDWKVIFVVDVEDSFQGERKFELEQQRYHDVIGFKDTNNPRKHVLKMMSAFEWVDGNCDFSFLVKMKNGIFLNTPKMFSFLRDPRVPATELYGGVVVYVKNNTAEFHTVDKRLVKGYPRFINDAFIMSFDVVNKIISKFHWLRPHIEADVYFGELVLQSGIDVWPIPNFLYHDRGSCAAYNLDGILIECLNNCTTIFDKANRKIIPEI